MADFLDFLPLVTRSEADIRASFDADANAYLNPGEEPIDTAEAGFFFLNTESAVMNQARAIDDINTKMAAAFLPFAWGPYLDYHGQQLRTPRKSAVRATGTVDFMGVDGTLIAINTQLTPTQTDEATPVPTFVTTASATIVSGVARDVPIEAVDPGSDGTVPAHAINVLRTLNPGIEDVDNPEPTLDGTDEEDDEDYLKRLLLAARGTGPGREIEYVRWGLEEPAVGRVKATAAWNGPNTVMSTLMARDGSPVSRTIIDRHQLRLDPVQGKGKGQAPVGVDVTVNTPVLRLIDVEARVILEDGYVLSDLVASLEASIQDYLNNTDVGEDVIINHIEAQFFRVEGVFDVELTTPSADVAIDGTRNPPEVARSGRITLS